MDGDDGLTQDFYAGTALEPTRVVVTFIPNPYNIEVDNPMCTNSEVTLKRTSGVKWELSPFTEARKINDGGPGSSSSSSSNLVLTVEIPYFVKLFVCCVCFFVTSLTRF